MIPVSFDGHLGAIHRPVRRGPHGVTVLICPPLGREARSAYRPLFLWAEDLAARGFQVLRYDHRGEGDSLALRPEADQWAYWLDGVAQAADFARTHTGARELVLAGLRIGGTFALMASRTVHPDGLILLAPAPTGAGWVRDLRLAAAIQQAPQPADGGVEVDGFRLSPATIASAEGADIRTVAPTWRSVFLAAPASGRSLAATLGPEVTLSPFEGYGRLFKEAHVNAAPTAVFDAAAGWLADFARSTPAARPAPCPTPAQLISRSWIDRPVSFGAGLRGVLCLPRHPAPGGRAVIIGNTAADPRAGVGNFAARASRALAAAGVAALRFDFRGVGESAPLPEGVQVHVYETPRLDDYREAAALLREHGFAEPIVAGVCTGGYHAVQAVIEPSEFRQAIAINSWLVWRPGRPLELRAETAKAEPRTPTPPGPRRPRWQRLVRGELDIEAAVTRRVKRTLGFWRPDAACRAVRAQIRRACREDLSVHVLLGRGDLAMHGLEEDFGGNCAWLRAQPGVSVAIVPDLDHALFSDESQQRAIREIFRALDLPLATLDGPDTPDEPEMKLAS